MMQQDRFDVLLETQRDYFRTGATLPVSFRVEMLKKLRAAVAKHEEEIARALKEDLGKGPYESYMCEEGMVLSELSWLIRRTPRLAAKTRVKTPLAQFASVSFTKPSPYGNVLIMSPWNYPFLLTIDPLAAKRIVFGKFLNCGQTCSPAGPSPWPSISSPRIRPASKRPPPAAPLAAAASTM